MLRRTLLACALLLALAPAARADGSKCTLIGGNGTQVECVQNQMPIGSNSLATAQPTATATAAPIVTARNTRAAVTIENQSTTAVFIGPAGVTAGNGMLLPGTVGASITIPTSAAVYGVTASGTALLSVLETY